MSRELYDWENDSELSTKSKIVSMPLSEEVKFQKKFEALENGYHFSSTGALEKEVTFEKPVYEYDPNDLKLDDKGRKYFFDHDGNRIYIDDFNQIYGIRCDINGENEEEYIVIGPSELLVFLNPEHTIGKDKNGNIYEYDTEQEVYVYNPNIRLFPNQKR